ncbi:MAG: hypothetical protein HOO08_03225, partial [Opitutae bacterium]|nr:hypothetical protein [Opitutae bacterium]
MKFNWIPLLTITALLGSGCSPTAKVTQSASDKNSDTNFQVKPEVDPATLDYTRKVDLNLGNSPEMFVTAIWKQLTGEDADAPWVAEKAELLGSVTTPRRIDLALLLAEEAGEDKVRWAYSDPWDDQPSLHGSPGKTVERDIGAVMMFFFSSPNKPNGGPGWSNNHAPGMLTPDPALNLEEQAETPHDGYFHPKNAAFWHRELSDARYAGLDFVLPNVYGPDLDDDHMKPLQIALAKLSQEDGDDVIKLGMFDDTWTWGQPYFGPFWEQKPDCNNVEATAKVLFEAKWKPYFNAVPRKHWYL